MREVTIYVADDGTQFEDEVDCIKYEEKQYDLCSVEAYWENYEKIGREIGIEEYTSCAAHFRIVNADKAEALFEYVHEMYGNNVPTASLMNGDIWAYSDVDDTWVELNDEAEELKRKIESLSR